MPEIAFVPAETLMVERRRAFVAANPDASGADLVAAIAAKTAGVPSDVGAMSCLLLAPNATAPITLTVVHDSAGQYHADTAVLETPGSYGYAFKATGTGLAAAESQFYIQTSGLL